MRIVLRSVLTLILVLITAFCGFGVLASAEGGPIGPANPLSWFYGIVGIACVAAIVAVWGVKATRRLVVTLVLVVIAAFCGFGFMASFFSWDFLRFRWLYAAVVIASVAAIIWVVKATRRQA